VLLRIALTIVAVKLLELPFLKLVGAAALLWIAVQLLIPEDGDGGCPVELPPDRRDQDHPDCQICHECRQCHRCGRRGEGKQSSCSCLASSSAFRLVIFGATMRMRTHGTLSDQFITFGCSHTGLDRGRDGR